MQIIGVRFPDNKGGYHQKVYHFYTTLDVRLDDLVFAPTTLSNTDNRVKVCALNVDPATLNQSVLPFMRTITERVKVTKPVSRFTLFIRDLLDFFPRIFRQSWISVKWDWDHRAEKNNRAKRRRRKNELDRIYRERWLQATGRLESQLSPAPEPKYYSGKVFAIKAKGHWIDDPIITQRNGRVFEIKDGFVIGNVYGMARFEEPYKSFDDFCKARYSTEWQEVKE
ncbi:MAG: hypothetical protein ABFC31_07185 [Clostridiaceae bacterium]